MEDPQERKKRVVDYCESMSSLRAWPRIERLNTRKWLDNFLPDEIPYALDILESLIVVTKQKAESMLTQALYSLSSVVLGKSRTRREGKIHWQNFRDKWLVSHITKESPHPTESGPIYSRMVRQVSGLPKEQIFTQEQLLKELLDSKGREVIVILVDDIIGSGNQCINYFRREFGSNKISIQGLLAPSTEYNIRVFYIPLFCTEYGLERIQNTCKGLELKPLHVLGDKYCANTEKSTIWQTEERKKGAENFVKTTTRRMGYTDNPFGFHDLALCLTFDYGPPDLTLPIIHSRGSGNWKPLIERT